MEMEDGKADARGRETIENEMEIGRGNDRGDDLEDSKETGRIR